MCWGCCDCSALRWTRRWTPYTTGAVLDSVTGFLRMLCDGECLVVGQNRCQTTLQPWQLSFQTRNGSVFKLHMTSRMRKWLYVHPSRGLQWLAQAIAAQNCQAMLRSSDSSLGFCTARVGCFCACILCTLNHSSGRGEGGRSHRLTWALSKCRGNLIIS